MGDGVGEVFKFADGFLKLRGAFGHEVFEPHGTVSELHLGGVQRVMSLALLVMSVKRTATFCSTGASTPKA